MQTSQIVTTVPSLIVDTGLISFIVGSGIFVAIQVVKMIHLFKNKNGNGKDKCPFNGVSRDDVSRHMRNVELTITGLDRREAEHRDQKAVLDKQLDLLNQMKIILENQTRILERIDARR